MITVIPRLKPYQVYLLRPDQTGYRSVRSRFRSLAADDQPVLTGIVVPIPPEAALTGRLLLLIQYCLEQVFAGQVCALTDYQSMDVGRFFDGLTLTGEQQIHALAHLVLACANELVEGEQTELHDCLTVTGETMIVWFSAEIDPDRLRNIVTDLHSDLEALMSGVIQGRIEGAIFP